MITFLSFHLFPEKAGPAFDEFLDSIGDRVLLKGFEGYRAQLDLKSEYSFFINSSIT